MSTEKIYITASEREKSLGSGSDMVLKEKR